jgi:apoptosis-inducing factor 2
VVLIYQKDHFEYNPFIVKVAQDEKIPETLFATFEETIKGYNNKFQFVQGKLLNVLKENTIEIQNPVTKSRSHIKYDALVIATGFLYNNPIKNDNAYSVTERKGAMQKFNKQVADAKSVLILGGGIVGVELAGEIAFHPDAANKKITLAVRGQRLLNQLPEDAHKAADSFLKTKNVEIQYNETDFSALKKKFDLVLECFGQTYKADFLKKSFLSAIA